ncbi:HK97 family phage prohead protease [Aeromonas popoffii]|uniref:HK97 family phage prohead protease n=1 Tax=Aeromonas popoffii TaxID=70856 RepID=UPI0030CD9D75
MNHQLRVKLNNFTESEQETGVFEAYGNVKWVVDSYREVAVDGAFKKSIARHKSEGTMPKMLWNHNPDIVIGKWLEMEEDDHGLKVKGQLALNTQRGRETYELLKMGALDALSIGFTAPKESYGAKDDVTYLEEIDLYEVSVVTFPANKQSTVTSVKSEEIEELNTSEEEQEQPAETSPETQPEVSEQTEIVEPVIHQKSFAEIFADAKIKATISLISKKIIRE